MKGFGKNINKGNFQEISKGKNKGDFLEISKGKSKGDFLEISKGKSKGYFQEISKGKSKENFLEISKGKSKGYFQEISKGKSKGDFIEISKGKSKGNNNYSTSDLYIVRGQQKFIIGETYIKLSNNIIELCSSCCYYNKSSLRCCTIISDNSKIIKNFISTKFLTTDYKIIIIKYNEDNITIIYIKDDKIIDDFIYAIIVINSMLEYIKQKKKLNNIDFFDKVYKKDIRDCDDNIIDITKKFTFIPKQKQKKINSIKQKKLKIEVDNYYIDDEIKELTKNYIKYSIIDILYEVEEHYKMFKEVLFELTLLQLNTNKVQNDIKVAKNSKKIRDSDMKLKYVREIKKDKDQKINEEKNEITFNITNSAKKHKRSKGLKLKKEKEQKKDKKHNTNINGIKFDEIFNQNINNNVYSNETNNQLSIYAVVINTNTSNQFEMIILNGYHKTKKIIGRCSGRVVYKTKKLGAKLFITNDKIKKRKLTKNTYNRSVVRVEIDDIKDLFVEIVDKLTEADTKNLVSENIIPENYQRVDTEKFIYLNTYDSDEYDNKDHNIIYGTVINSGNNCLNIRVLNNDRAGENIKCKICNANLLSSSSHKKDKKDKKDNDNFDINKKFKPFVVIIELGLPGICNKIIQKLNKFETDTLVIKNIIPEEWNKIDKKVKLSKQVSNIYDKILLENPEFCDSLNNSDSDSSDSDSDSSDSDSDSSDSDSSNSSSDSSSDSDSSNSSSDSDSSNSNSNSDTSESDSSDAEFDINKI